MRNPESWTASKFVVRNGRLTATRLREHLASSSVLLAQMVAERYDDALGHYAQGRLIDLGCGTVPLYEFYAQRVSSSICVDWPSTLHDARHVDAWSDLRRPLPIRSGVADTVLSSDVLEHLPEPGLAFSEIARILAPGGYLLLNTPFMYRVHEAPHDFLRHTEFSLRALARRNGLEVVEMHHLGGSLDVLADIVGKLVETLPVVGPRLARVIALAALAFGRTSLGQLARRRTRAVFPLGLFLVARRTGGCSPSCSTLH